MGGQRRRISLAFDFAFSARIPDGRIIGHPSASFERDPSKHSSTGRAQLLELFGQNHWHEFMKPQELQRELKRVRQRQRKAGMQRSGVRRSEGNQAVAGMPLALDWIAVEESYGGGLNTIGPFDWGGVLELPVPLATGATKRSSAGGTATARSDAATSGEL